MYVKKKLLDLIFCCSAEFGIYDCFMTLMCVIQVCMCAVLWRGGQGEDVEAPAGQQCADDREGADISSA